MNTIIVHKNNPWGYTKQELLYAVWQLEQSIINISCYSVHRLKLLEAYKKYV